MHPFRLDPSRLANTHCSQHCRLTYQRVTEIRDDEYASERPWSTPSQDDFTSTQQIAPDNPQLKQPKNVGFQTPFRRIHVSDLSSRSEALKQPSADSLARRNRDDGSKAPEPSTSKGESLEPVLGSEAHEEPTSEGEAHGSVLERGSEAHEPSASRGEDFGSAPAIGSEAPQQRFSSGGRLASAPGRWWCCRCNDGPKSIKGQPECRNCEHIFCTDCRASRGSVREYWYCCCCNDGPKILELQPQCIICSHDHCRTCTMR